MVGVRQQYFQARLLAVRPAMWENMGILLELLPLFTIYNLSLKIEPTPLQSLGAIVCKVFNPILPQRRAKLCVLDYGVGSAIALNSALAIQDGFAIIPAPEFARVDYVEIGGDVYSEAQDYTALLSGEYVYNADTETLIIRVY